MDSKKHEICGFPSLFLARQSWLSSNYLQRSRRPQSCSNPAAASQLLGLQTWAHVHQKVALFSNSSFKINYRGMKISMLHHHRQKPFFITKHPTHVEFPFAVWDDREMELSFQKVNHTRESRELTEPGWTAQFVLKRLFTDPAPEERTLVSELQR